MARTSVEDPLKVFRFIVEIDGMARAGFMEASGLERTTEVAEYREGGDNETMKKSAGLSAFSDITLRRGQILDEGQNDFYNWAQEVHNVSSLGGNVRDYRRDIDIVQFERGGVEVKRWRVFECWPNRFKPFGDLNATSTSDNSIEELSLVNEGFELVT
jgi:phage tail-like protein